MTRVMNHLTSPLRTNTAMHWLTKPGMQINRFSFSAFNEAAATWSAVIQAMRGKAERLKFSKPGRSWNSV